MRARGPSVLSFEARGTDRAAQRKAAARALVARAALIAHPRPRSVGVAGSAAAASGDAAGPSSLLGVARVPRTRRERRSRGLATLGRRQARCGGATAPWTIRRSALAAPDSARLASSSATHTAVYASAN